MTSLAKKISLQTTRLADSSERLNNSLALRAPEPAQRHVRLRNMADHGAGVDSCRNLDFRPESIF